MKPAAPGCFSLHSVPQGLSHGAPIKAAGQGRAVSSPAPTELCGRRCSWGLCPQQGVDCGAGTRGHCAGSQRQSPAAPRGLGRLVHPAWVGALLSGRSRFPCMALQGRPRQERESQDAVTSVVTSWGENGSHLRFHGWGKPPRCLPHPSNDACAHASADAGVVNQKWGGSDGLGTRVGGGGGSGAELRVGIFLRDVSPPRRQLCSLPREVVIVVRLPVHVGPARLSGRQGPCLPLCPLLTQ